MCVYIRGTKQGLSQSMPIHKQTCSICATHTRHPSPGTQHKPCRPSNDKFQLTIITSTNSCFAHVFLETISHERPSSCVGNLGRCAQTPPTGSYQVLQISKSCVWVFWNVWAQHLTMWLWHGWGTYRASSPSLYFPICKDRPYLLPPEH